MTLSTNPKNHFLLLRWSFGIYLCYIPIFIYFIYYSENFISGVWSIVAMNCFFLLNFIPEVILHVKYYLVNRRNVYNIQLNKIIITDTNLVDINIDKDNIKEFKLVKPANLDDGWGIHFVGITNYYYLKITLKNEQVYYLTNLLHPNIDLILKENGFDFYRKNGFGWF